jgi:hypothetical protein
MSNATAKQLSEVIGISVNKLLSQLADAGVSVTDENAPIADKDKLLLLESLRSSHGSSQGLGSKGKGIKVAISLSDIKDAKDLRELDGLLTKLMAKQQIQPLIQDKNLGLVTDCIFELATTEPEQELLAAAMLGRLAAVARSRGVQVFERANGLFTKEPSSIETLDDGDAKAYACTYLKHTDAPWLADYSYREAMLIDTADIARRELLSACLDRDGKISIWINSISEQSNQLSKIENPESKVKRVRRIFAAIRDVAFLWRGELGPDIGRAISESLRAFIKVKLLEQDQEILFESVDNLMSVLNRVIELRFSIALYASTYETLVVGKKLLGAGIWGRYLDKSSVMPDLRVSLLEAALVVARQNNEDKDLMGVLLASYTSHPQVSSAIRRHFSEAKDLVPYVSEWWCSAGKEASGRGKSSRKLGNTEDNQIGALLIEVEDSREVIEKLRRAVIPLLEVYDAVLATTVEKAASGYTEMAQISRRLARMRKLTKTDKKGERLQYNILEHEMIGGHKPGVRRVKVVRDGIEKELGGHRTTLVKPLVEPDE